MLSSQIHKHFSPAETVAIRHFLMHSVSSGDETAIAQATKEAQVRFGGTTKQIGAKRAWLEIFPARLIRAAGLKGQVQPRELLKLAIRLRESKQAGTGAPENSAPLADATLSDLAVELNISIDRARPLTRALSTQTDLFAHLNLPGRSEVRKLALEMFRDKVRLAALAVPQVGQIQYSVQVAPPVAQPLSEYLSYILDQISAPAQNWLTAIALCGGGDIRYIKKCAIDLQIPVSRAAAHLRELQALHLITSGAGGKRLLFVTADPFVALALASQALRTEKFGTLAPPAIALLIGAFNDSLRAITASKPS